MSEVFNSVGGWANPLCLPQGVVGLPFLVVYGVICSPGVTSTQSRCAKLGPGCLKADVPSWGRAAFITMEGPAGCSFLGAEGARQRFLEEEENLV